MIAAPETTQHGHVMNVAKFKRLFHLAAGLDVDKQDVKRYSDFINRKVYDLLHQAQIATKANRRDIIEPYDLPITKGLQECIHQFERIDEQLELQPVLDQLTARPPLDFGLGAETELRLAKVAGGLSIALARTFKLIDEDLKNPQTAHWERSFRIFDLLL